MFTTTHTPAIFIHNKMVIYLDFNNRLLISTDTDNNFYQIYIDVNGQKFSQIR